MNLRLIFLESFAETVASIALVGLGAGAAGAAFGRALGYFFGSSLPLRQSSAPPPAAAPGPIGPAGGLTRQVALYAVPLFVTTQRVHAVCAGRRPPHPRPSLGRLRSVCFLHPLSLCTPLTYIGQALANRRGAAPGKGRRQAGPRRRPQKSIRWLVISQAPPLLPIIVWADPIITLLFGTNYAGSVDVLRSFSSTSFSAASAHCSRRP